jgi:hypothetical protein
MVAPPTSNNLLSLIHFGGNISFDSDPKILLLHGYAAPETNGTINDDYIIEKQ